MVILKFVKVIDFFRFICSQLMDWWVYYVHMKKMINKKVKTTNLKQALQNRVFISSGSKKSCKGHGCR